MSICPKNKSSKARRDKRRANWKMAAPNLVIVDGKFDLERRDVSLPWKGSPNQRVIDVPKSREVGLVVLHA